MSRLLAETDRQGLWPTRRWRPKGHGIRVVVL